MARAGAPKKPAAKGVSPALVRAVDKLVREVVDERVEAGKEPKYSLTDKMKVLDRRIKLEAIRLKVMDNEEGTFFQPKGAENDDADE